MGSPAPSPHPVQPPSPRGSRPRRFRRRLLALLFGVLLTGVLFLVCELAVRMTMPWINFQGLDAHLMDPDPPEGLWHANMPGTAGVAFGAPVRFDDQGCRIVGRPESPRTVHLILGDSVAFGVGVPAEDTFAGLLQATDPHTEVLNAAVCGMTAEEYPVVARRMFAARNDIERVTLVYCLNDLGVITEMASQERPFEQVVDFTRSYGPLRRTLEVLRYRSKLFLLIKGLFSNAPERYYRFAEENYAALDIEKHRSLEPIAAVAAFVQERGASIEVVVMPYQQQYRIEGDEAWMPQRKVGAFLERRGIPYRDAREWFRAAGRDPWSCYLFGDGIHFNTAGHRVIFEQLGR